MAWKTVPDEKVRHDWKCPECNAKERVSPDFYQDNGTPMCSDCEEYMIYVRTQIEVLHG